MLSTSAPRGCTLHRVGPKQAGRSELVEHRSKQEPTQSKTQHLNISNQKESLSIYHSVFVFEVIV